MTEGKYTARHVAKLNEASVYDRDGNWFALTHGPDCHERAMKIATAINSHDDLVAALDRLVRTVEFLPESLTEPDSAIGQARAALAKAGENNG